MSGVHVCVPHGVFPIGCEAFYRIGDAGPYIIVEVAVEKLDAGEACGRNGLEIGGNAVFRHIAADEMEPGFGIILFRRILRGCFIISVKSQVGVFLLKLHIVKREHSGGYVTDERWAS